MLALLALLLAVATPPPQTHPCSEAIYHALDFWVAITEHYVGVRDAPGRSISMYDAATDQWKQRYVTARGRLTDYTGSVLPDGSMQLVATIAGAQVRMTYTLLPDGTVRQRFESSRDGGRTWTPPSDLIYTRRP